MLKEDDSEHGTATNAAKDDEILEAQLQNYSSPPRNLNESEEYQRQQQQYQQQQHPPPPTITKNTRQMHRRLSIIPGNRKGDLNGQYLKSVPGILKMVELLIGFVAFILAICADRRSTLATWTEHVAFESTFVVTGLLIGYVIFPHLTIADERTQRGLHVLELIFYGCNTAFYFISIWLMIHLSASQNVEGQGAAIMTAILCVGLCGLYAIETFTKFKVWQHAGATKQSVTPTPTMEIHQNPPTPVQSDV